MSIKRPIRCILFDLGSTLWTRQEEAASLAKARAYTSAGHILRCAYGDALFPSMDVVTLGMMLQKAVSKRIRQKKRLRPEFEPDFVLTTLEALRLAGVVQADRSLAEAIFEALRIRIPVSRALFADTLPTLAALKQRGYVLGVVTNRDHGGALFQEDLQTMGLLAYFEYQHMAISADLGIRKPHPAIFRHALTRLNVAPEETAMVGDNLDADVAGAQRLHIFSIWKPKTPSHREEAKRLPGTIIPDVTIDDLSELLGIF